MNNNNITNNSNHNINQNNDLNNDPDANNGLLPRIWGPHMWESLHCITFNYPLRPTEEHKKSYRAFFEVVGYMLPCGSCRESFLDFMANGPNKITDEIFESRDTLTLWLYNVHNDVNHKLGVTYAITYEEVKQKYESFRVKCDPNQPGCIMNIEQRKISYCNEYEKDYPIVPYNVIKCFEVYALKRNIDFSSLDKINQLYVNNDKCDDWHDRNKKCDEIIKYMRTNAIPAIEQEGEFKGLPTIEELKLMALMTSSMNLTEISKAAKHLGYNIKKVYRFTN